MALFFAYLKRYKWLVIVSFVLAAVNQSFSLMDPIIFGKLINVTVDYAALDGVSQTAFLQAVGWLIAASLAVSMISRIAKAFQEYTTNLVIQHIGADIYTDGLRHSLRIPYQDFEDKQSGSTLNVLQRVRTDSEKFILSFINTFFIALVGIVFVLIVSLRIYGPMFFVYVAATVLIYAVIHVLSRKIKQVQFPITRDTNVLAGATTESLRNVELIKSLGLTQQEIGRLNTATRKILQLELNKVRSLRSIAFIQGTMVNVLRQSILFFLLFLTFKGQMSIGEVTTLQLFSFFIFTPLQEMGTVMMNYREAQASLDNFQTIMQSPIEIVSDNPTPLARVETLSFDDVTFQYKAARQPAVEHISFAAKRGETIAFVGPSGSGKTTLVKLLVGLYRPHKGHIYYNDTSASDVNLDALRARIGFVTQDTQLFSGSLRDNLLFVNPSADEATMMDVLHKAACEHILNRAEDGLDTLIGEGGMRLSGGEKQRLAIARALLRHPELLIFDEATSALDSMTEEMVSRTVRDIARSGEHITVMIAHRLSTIMHADRIYVLEKGRIIETGRHDDLLAEKGLYYAMWRQQIGERTMDIESVND